MQMRPWSRGRRMVLIGLVLGVGLLVVSRPVPVEATRGVGGGLCSGPSQGGDPFGTVGPVIRDGLGRVTVGCAVDGACDASPTPVSPQGVRYAQDVSGIVNGDDGGTDGEVSDDPCFGICG